MPAWPAIMIDDVVAFGVSFVLLHTMRVAESLTAAPVLEELIFRGIMLDGLLQRCRPMTANLSGFVIRFFMDAEAAMDRDTGYLANDGGAGPFVTTVALAWVVIALVVWLLRREFRRRDGASPWVARESVA